MKTLTEIANEVIDTWAGAGRIPLPDKASRPSLMPAAFDLARMVQRETISLDDIYSLIKEKLRQQEDREKTYLWSLHAISRDIYAWKQTREKPKIKFPKPPGWQNYTNPQTGETLVWDYDTGKVLTIPPAVPSEVNPQGLKDFPSTPYQRLTQDETIVKRYNRLGYEHSFYLSSDELTDEERQALEDLSSER